MELLYGLSNFANNTNALRMKRVPNLGVRLKLGQTFSWYTNPIRGHSEISIFWLVILQMAVLSVIERRKTASDIQISVLCQAKHSFTSHSVVNNKMFIFFKRKFYSESWSANFLTIHFWSCCLNWPDVEYAGRTETFKTLTVQTQV